MFYPPAIRFIFKQRPMTRRLIFKQFRAWKIYRKRDCVAPSAFGYVSNKQHALRNHTVLTTLRLRSPSPRTKILNFSTPSAANWLKNSVSPISFQTLKRKTASSALPNLPRHTACIARTTVDVSSHWQRGVGRTCRGAQRTRGVNGPSSTVPHASRRNSPSGTTPS